jgi:hypothetical protein
MHESSRPSRSERQVISANSRLHRRGFIKLALVSAAAPLVYSKPSIAAVKNTANISPGFALSTLTDVPGTVTTDACGNRAYLFSGSAKSSVYGSKVTLTELSITGVPNPPGGFGMGTQQLSNANAMRGSITGPGTTGDSFSGTAQVVYSDVLNAASVLDVNFSGEVVGNAVVELTLSTTSFNGMCAPATPAVIMVDFSGPATQSSAARGTEGSK